MLSALAGFLLGKYMTDAEQSNLPGGEVASASADATLSDLSAYNERLAEYREAEKRDGRILRLVHASAIVGITAFSAILAMKGLPALALRAFGGGLLIYLIVWIVFGLILQWRRELSADDT